MNENHQRRPKVGEVAGGTAAECAAVCCCCPLTVVNVVVMVVYKAPAGLCRRVKNKKRREKARTIKKRLLKDDEFDDVSDITAVVVPFDGGVEEAEIEAVEVWKQFHGTGFWRSPSQRENL